MFDPELSRTAPAGEPPSNQNRSRTGDRRMKVSPLDLRQVRFRTTFRGFDRAEVMGLLTEVAEDYENALRDVDHLRQDVSKAEALLDQHREHEKDLRNTMITAQKVSEDLRANAEAQARQIIREAEGRSDLLLQKTQARLEDVQREIDGMKLKRREVENSLEASIATLRSTLEFVREQEQRDRDEKILLHRPRQVEAQQATSAIRAEETKAANNQ
jgi:cell division initiation protein